MRTSKKILCLASAGGHWIQLVKLTAQIDHCEKVYASTLMELRRDCPDSKFYLIPEGTRWNKFKLILIALKILRLILKEKPDCIITTGAAPGYFALRIGKWLGCKTVWLDSVANLKEVSLSGRLVKKYADLSLTQSQRLSSKDLPMYYGRVF